MTELSFLIIGLILGIILGVVFAFALGYIISLRQTQADSSANEELINALAQRIIDREREERALK